MINKVTQFFRKTQSADLSVEYHKSQAALSEELKKYNEKNRVALVLHLYYPEMWGEIFHSFSERLVSKYDIFITTPSEKKADTIRAIEETNTKAFIFPVPNKGRDVLPFLYLSEVLISQGYECFLKVHSKKSPQRIDGNEWLDDMLRKLVPEQVEIQSQIEHLLRDPHTGLIGPSEHYIPLPVSTESRKQNYPYMVSLAHKDKIKKNVLKNIKRWDDFGFFEGTMFWGRFDAIYQVVSDNSDYMLFQHEAGQTDGTRAHAVERALSVFPELDKKNMYQVDSHGVSPIAYASDDYPAWSDLSSKEWKSVTVD